MSKFMCYNIFLYKYVIHHLVKFSARAMHSHTLRFFSTHVSDGWKMVYANSMQNSEAQHLDKVKTGSGKFVTHSFSLHIYKQSCCCWVTGNF
jgi:hypothetical protein